MNDFQRYLKSKRGRAVALGKAIERSPSAITQWKGLVPIDLVPRVSKLTRIPKHALRPDLPDLFPPPRARSPARCA